MGGGPGQALLRMNDEEVRKLKAEGERREAQIKKQAAEEVKVKANRDIGSSETLCHTDNGTTFYLLNISFV